MKKVFVVTLNEEIIAVLTGTKKAKEYYNNMVNTFVNEYNFAITDNKVTKFENITGLKNMKYFIPVNLQNQSLTILLLTIN